MIEVVHTGEAGGCAPGAGRPWQRPSSAPPFPLRKEVADLERQDEELTDSVIAAGVSISVRPDVLARRQEEADRADAAERVIENRAKRQARLNEAARESGVPAVRLVG